MLTQVLRLTGVSKTLSFDHIEQHYYVSQRAINPTQVVANGPVLDLDRPHRRHDKGVTER